MMLITQPKSVAQVKDTFILFLLHEIQSSKAEFYLILFREIFGSLQQCVYGSFVFAQGYKRVGPEKPCVKLVIAKLNGLTVAFFRFFVEAQCPVDDGIIIPIEILT